MQARSPESQGVRCDACLPGAKLKEFRRDLADAHALLTRSLALRPPYPLQGSAECHKKVHFRPPLSCRTECVLVDGTVVVGREPFSGLCVIGLPLPQPISCSADEVRVGFGYSLSFRAFDDGTNLRFGVILDGYLALLLAQKAFGCPSAIVSASFTCLPLLDRACGKMR